MLNVYFCVSKSCGQGKRNILYPSGNKTELVSKTDYYSLKEWGLINAASETDCAQ